uniref:DNA-directed RNA polymerase n=1 Tax=Halimeda minima TaxID=170427 RepID=A0A386AYS7_9CHLO|nr:RNA polymerase b-subunit [Halimeda minima]
MPTIFFNYCFDKRRFSNFLQWFFRKNGHKKLLHLLENLKLVGFHSATEAGFSISIEDLIIPELKSTILFNSLSIVKDLTPIENYQKIIKLWNNTNETLKYQVLQSFQISDFLNPVYLMAFSGARGNISQIRQLVSMRGLMADPQGQIIDFPIRSNFREGLTLTEYLISCSGARKGIVDTALRTAASGYLTRRLVDVAHHVIISQIDCKSEKGFLLENLYDQKTKILSLEQRLVGRILAETILRPSPPPSGARSRWLRSEREPAFFGGSDSEVIGKKNQEISQFLSIQICNYRNQVLIRSPLTCSSSKFICQLCYGWNLAEGQLVSIGEAVGILAAQSIGEPGTQLTMRTFHTGGVFTGTVIDQTYSPSAGNISYPFFLGGLLIRTQQGQIAYLTKNSGTLKIQKIAQSVANASLERLLNFHSGQLGFIRRKNPFLTNIYQTTLIEKQTNLFFVFQHSTILYARQREQIKKNQLLAEVPFFHTEGFGSEAEKEHEVLSPISGEIFFENLVIFEKTRVDVSLRSRSSQFNFAEIWVLCGKPINRFFFKKLDLIAGYLPFTQLEILHTTLRSERAPEAPLSKDAVRARKESRPRGFQLGHIRLPEGAFGGRPKLSNMYFQKISYYVIKNQWQFSARHSSFLTSTAEAQSHGIIFIFNPQGLFKKKILSTCFKLKWLFEPLKKIPKIWSRLNINGCQPKIIHWKDIPLQKSIFLINFLLKNVQNKNAKLPSLGTSAADPLRASGAKGDARAWQLPKGAEAPREQGPLRGPSPRLLEGFVAVQSQSLWQTGGRGRLWKEGAKPLGIYSFIRIPIFISKNNPLTSLRAKFFSPKLTKKNLIIYLQEFKWNFWTYFKTCSLREPPSPASPLPLTRSKPLKLKAMLGSSSQSLRATARLWRAVPQRGTRGRANKCLSASLRAVKYFDTYYFLLINFQNIQNNNIRFLQNLGFSTFLLLCSKPHRHHCSRESAYKGITASSPAYGPAEGSSGTRRPNAGSEAAEGEDEGFLVWSGLALREPLQCSISCPPEASQLQPIASRDHKPSKQAFEKARLSNVASRHLYRAVSLSELPRRPLVPLWGTARQRRAVAPEAPLAQSEALRRVARDEPLAGDEQYQKWQKSSKNFQIIKRNYYRSQKIQIFVRFFKYFRNAEILDLRVSQKKILFSTISDLFCQYSQISKLGSLVHNPRGGQRIAQIQKISLYRKATNFLLNNQSILYGQYGSLCEQNERLCTVFYSQPKTGDIVQGIPKIEQILEVRVHKHKSAIADSLGAKPTQAQAPAQPFRSNHLQKSVLSNIQRIYGGQGIYISDKHIEIIVRQMTSNALILEPGQTGLLCDEIVSLQWIERINSTLISNKVIYEPILMGMTQTCLEMSSFLSAASFQETTRVLSRAALQNQIDFIRGIKQNVILGNLIPIGTGCF